MSKKDTWIGEIPKYCNICKQDIIDVFIDGRIGTDLNSPWGLMCETCRYISGIKLKWGHGQKYKKIKQKWICIEGLERKS